MLAIRPAYVSRACACLLAAALPFKVAQAAVTTDTQSASLLAGAAFASGAAQQARPVQAFAPDGGVLPSPETTASGLAVLAPVNAGAGVAVRYVPGQGLMELDTRQVAPLGQRGSGAVDSIRFSTTVFDARPGATLLGRPGAPGDTSSAQDFDLTYLRAWPSALSLGSGRYSLDLSPSAGLGVSNAGGQSAEAGATVRFGGKTKAKNEALQAMGVGDGSRYGEEGRWYLFASAKGRAVGLNLLHGDSGWGADGLTSDKGGFVGQAQAGLGWRSGGLQASLGYTRERIKSHLMGARSQGEDRFGVTFSLRGR